MSLREKRILLIAAAAVLLFFCDLVVLKPFNKERDALDKRISEKKQELDRGKLIIEHQAAIRQGWEFHELKEPTGTSEDLAASFQEDLLGIFKEAGIQTDSLVKRGEVDLRAPKGFKEITFTASFSGENDDLIELQEALDGYDGYLRINMMQINAQKAKRRENLDVKLEVSTIWFNAGNGVRS